MIVYVSLSAYCGQGYSFTRMKHEMIVVFPTSTGSVPHSPAGERKSRAVERPVSRGADNESPTPGEDRPARRRSLQRSHTIGVGSRPPPNKALLKGDLFL